MPSSKVSSISITSSGVDLGSGFLALVVMALISFRFTMFIISHWGEFVKPFWLGVPNATTFVPVGATTIEQTGVFASESATTYASVCVSMCDAVV